MTDIRIIEKLKRAIEIEHNLKNEYWNKAQTDNIDEKNFYYDMYRVHMNRKHALTDFLENLEIDINFELQSQDSESDDYILNDIFSVSELH